MIAGEMHTSFAVGCSVVSSRLRVTTTDYNFTKFSTKSILLQRSTPRYLSARLCGLEDKLDICLWSKKAALLRSAENMRETENNVSPV